MKFQTFISFSHLKVDTELIKWLKVTRRNNGTHTRFYLILSYLDLSLVDELQHVLEVAEPNVGGHHDHGVLAGVLAEHHLEVGARGAEDDLVCLDSVGRVLVHVGQHQGDVGEALRQQDLVEDGEHVALVVAPLEVEQLRLVRPRRIARDRVHGEAVTD